MADTMKPYANHSSGNDAFQITCHQHLPSTAIFQRGRFDNKKNGRTLIGPFMQGWDNIC